MCIFWRKCSFNVTSFISFVQTSTYEIVFAERAGSCLRLFNRLHCQVYNFASDCQQHGKRDGINPLFTDLSSMIQDNLTPCVLYVIDYYGYEVRMVTKSLVPHVTTLIKWCCRHRMSLIQDYDGKSLYITHLDGLGLFNLVTNKSTDIVSESTDFAAMIYDSNIGFFVSIIILQNN